MKGLLPLLIQIYCHIIKVSGVLEWTVIGKVTDYGQDVTLFCNVSNCCPKYAGWDRWTPHQRTLFIDLKTARPNKKYYGKVFSDGYTLVIQNLTKKDLNVSYSCLYGVTLGEKKFLLEEDVFIHIPDAHQTFSTGSNRYSKAEIAGCTVGAVAIAVIFTFAVILLLRKRKKGKVNATERDAYMKAIQTKEETRRYVRIQVVGKYGVGKSSLVRRLLGQGIDDVKSTDGIDIIKKCQIKTSNLKWIVHKDDIEKKERIRRLHNALNQTDKNKTTYLDEPFKTQKNKNQVKYSDLLSRTTEDEECSLLEEKQSLNKHGISEALDNNPDVDNSNITNNNSKEPTHNKDKYNTPGLSYDSAVVHHDNQYQFNLKKYEGKLLKNMDALVIAAKRKTDSNTSDLIECGIWDFAGQKEYYATHQTFFTKHGLYLLVADLNDALKETNKDNNFDSVESFIEFWFDSVHCFCEDSEEEKLCPAIFVVFTGIDKIDELDNKKQAYEQKLLTFKKSRKGDHMRGVYYISNTRFNEEDRKEIDRLRTDISESAKDEKFSEKLPSDRILLENALTVLKESTEKIHILSWDKMEELAYRTLLEGKKHLINFLENQHKIGNVIYFDDIKDYIILNPNWLVKCFRCLVCDSDKKDYNLIPKSAWDKLTSTGEISKKSIYKLFEKESDLKLEKRKQYLLNVMEKFDIIVKPGGRHQFESYYMPCMIEQLLTVEDIKRQFFNENYENFHCTPWLVLEFEFLPFASFNHILFHYIKRYQVCEENSGTAAIYRGKAVFYLDTKRVSKFIVCFSRNAISLQIWTFGNVNKKATEKECAKSNIYGIVLSELCNNIEKIMKKCSQNAPFSIKAKCSEGDYSDSKGRIGYNELPGDSEYWCNEHKHNHNKQTIETTWLQNAENRRLSEMEKWKSHWEGDKLVMTKKIFFLKKPDNKFIPKNPEYESMKARLDSFKDWPSDKQQKPEDLARAGLFYSGPGDGVTCFHCNTSAKDWDYSDKPWDVHSDVEDCLFAMENKRKPWTRRISADDLTKAEQNKDSEDEWV